MAGPVVFYHMMAVKRLIGSSYDTWFDEYKTPLTEDIKAWLYRPYIKRMREIENELAQQISGAYNGIRTPKSSNRLGIGLCLGQFWRRFKRIRKSILRGASVKV